MTINKKLDFAFIGVLVAFAILLLALDSIFIDSFYSRQKKTSLYQAYSELSTYWMDNSTYTIDSNELQTEAFSLSKEYNTILVVFDELGNATNTPFNMGINCISDLGITATLSTGDTVSLNTVDAYSLYIKPSAMEVVYEAKEDKPDDPNSQNKQYSVAIIGQILQSDTNTILGYAFLYTTYTSMKENTKIFNAFILYVTVILLIVALIIVYFLSNRFTKPIKDAEAKTRKIANLDFSTKLEVTSQDEIGSLAISINKMSDELEKNINNLKKANAALEKDILLKEKINNMREEFISDVSHELKTPISIISGYSEALKLEGLSQEDINGYADIIIDESARMNKLVRDLLKYTQIESGFINLEKDDFDVKDIIESITKPNELKLKEKEIKLSVNVPNVSVNGDYDMLQTVFSNFFSNAINHCDNERIIDVSGEIIKNKLRISVSNTGEQISEENQMRIWDSFYKIDKARSRQYGGTGLGLAVVKTIMEAYKNQYGVFNNEGGVTFFFDLNLSKQISKKETKKEDSTI